MFMMIKIKKFSKKLTLDHKIILLLFLMVILLKIPILNTPYYFDDIHEHNLAVWISEHNFFPFPPLSDILYYYGHPPLFYEVLAIFYSIFGTAFWVSHISVILFSFLGVTFTYLLGSYLCNRKVGLIAARRTGHKK